MHFGGFWLEHSLTLTHMYFILFLPYYIYVSMDFKFQMLLQPGFRANYIYVVDFVLLLCFL